MIGEVHVVNIELGALSNATRPGFPAPSDANGGGITILEAYAVQGGSTNSSLRLVKGTIDAGGTFTANGTIDSAAIGGTGSPFAANIVQTWTISTAFVDAAEWVAVAEGNVAACNTVANAVVSYTMGK